MPCILDSRYWIPDSWSVELGFLVQFFVVFFRLFSGFQCPGFQNPESGLPSMWLNHVKEKHLLLGSALCSTQCYVCSSHYSYPIFNELIFLFGSQLVVGDRGLTVDESKVQFAIWAIMAAVSSRVFSLQKQ